MAEHAVAGAPLTVAERLARRAAMSPTAVAFWHRPDGGDWQPVDWAGFHGQVAQLRRSLAAAGLRRGDRLALVAPVSLHWELLHHAVMALGASVVGLDAHDLPARLASMAAQSGVQAFAVADPALLDGLAPAQRQALRLVVDLGPADAAWPADLPRRPVAALLAAGTGDRPEPPPASADDEATVIFTSGTTGAPKGIAYSHAQLGLAIDAIGEAFDFVGVGGRLLCWLPLSNLFQRVVNLAAVRNGASTWLLADPRQVMDHVAAVAPDVFIGVPRFYEKLHAGLLARIGTLPAPLRGLVRWAWRTGLRLRARRLAGSPVPAALALQHRLAEALVLQRLRAVLGARLRCLVSGSAPMPAALLDDFEALGWPLLEAYGLSENVLPMAMNRLGDRRPGTVGRPLAGNEIRIGADGIVQVRGPGVFNGYLGEAPGTGRDADGWYATGDLGSLDADGFLRLTGRLGDLIKTSTGRRIAPVAVEAVLQSATGVDQAALFGAGRKMLVAVCTCAPGGLAGAAWPVLQAAIADAVRRLPPVERPAGVLVLDRPFSMADGELTPNLKLRRAAIERRLAADLDRLCAAVDARPGGADAGPLVLPGTAPATR